MSKKLEPLEALEDLISFIGSGEIADTHELCEYVAKRKDIIEAALKKQEEQDEILKTIKGVIQFDSKLPDIKIEKNIDSNEFISAITIKIQRSLENQERKLFRNWILRECFPKELKALEIINNKGLVNLYVYEPMLTKEEYELLNEVLI